MLDTAIFAMRTINSMNFKMKQHFSTATKWFAMN